jgi:hypothetical protein
MRWRGVVVAVVVVSAIIVNGQEKRPETSTDQGHAEPLRNSCTPSPQVVCVVNQPSTNQENNRPQGQPDSYLSRLVSPETLATIGLIGVGVWGILVAIGTLNHMRDSSERQLRAYVLPDNAGIIDGTMLAIPQANLAGIPGTLMLVRNYGVTPAYKVVSWAKIDVILVADENTLVAPPLPEKFYNALGPNGTFSKEIWFHRQLAANEIADIARGERAIFLYGRIEYRDAFKKPRFSTFRLRYWGQFPPPPNAVFNFSENGNDADY